ncbi:MAG TPA: hypothetical protein DIU15_10175 [Deltaproteobacteria bacterium]|nr:hypothetical protein [Deltaproteobacteria bacterium]HCP46400.1 hypothetical protein [Deltaproteobacteria bacterium]
MGSLDAEGRAERIAELAAIERLARKLAPMAKTFVATAVLGLAGSAGVIFYLWRDWKLGYGVHPPIWEALTAAIVGGAVGLGLSLPFAFWFLLQAGIARVQLRLEENTRIAGERATETALSIQSIADAGMTGEFMLRDTGETAPVEPSME